jgi:hypothetical protein
MFPSPCSLRSAQCATLIALAAAAGIMRVEQAASPTAVPAFDYEEPALVAASASGWTDRIHSLALVATKRCFSIGELQDVAKWKFETASDEVPPMVRLGQAPVDPTTDSVNSNADSSPIVAAGYGGMYSEGTFGAPSARQHSYPYAVGPPRTRANSNPRADDTSVSGDLAACRTLVLQVALGFQLPLGARRTRESDQASKRAGTFSEPSFALRGEPEHLERSFVGSRSANPNPLADASSHSVPV